MGFVGDEGHLEQGFVHESHITDEVQMDLKQLGWIVVPYQDDYP
jgi:hypothetical protein